MIPSLLCSLLIYKYITDKNFAGYLAPTQPTKTREMKTMASREIPEYFSIKSKLNRNRLLFGDSPKVCEYTF
jgi:hypothetical protein